MDLGMTQLSQFGDINKLCRTCLNKQNDMIPIFNEYFVNMLLTCTNIKVFIGDGLPCNICVTCRKLLYLSYFFKKKCEKANNALNSYLLEKKMKTQNPENIAKCDATNDYCKDDISSKDLCYLANSSSSSNTSLDLDDVLKKLNFCKSKTIKESKETQTDVIYSSNIKFECINEFNDATVDEGFNYTNDKYLSKEQKPDIITENNPSGNAKPYMVTRSSKNTEEKYRCDICKKDFLNFMSLQKHQFIHEKKIEQDCSDSSKTYTEIKKRNISVRSHKASLSNVCSECNKTFRDQKCLQRHMKIHNGIKSHMCTLCGKAFLHSETLDTHMRSHTGEKPYECAFCQKSFMTSSNLVVHRRRHTGERPYQCNICQKTFISSGILKQHELVHSGEKRYSCSVCGKRVARQYDLTTHMRSHSGEKPYTCQLCKKKFATSSHLAVHKRKHKDERNYVCPTCGKAFMESGVLKSHLRVHSGEKPYQCTICNRAFSQSGSLSTHMKAHQKVK